MLPRPPIRCRCAPAALLLALVTLLAALPLRAGGNRKLPDKLRIGVARSLFRDVPEGEVRGSTRPFQAFVQSRTKIPAELRSPVEFAELAEQLAQDRLQLGVFQGVEFAWVRKEHPELRPLLIAVNRHRYRRAYLVVRQDCPAAGWAGLAGKVLALPRRSREHCLLFLERHCRQAGKEPEQFFSRITTPPDTEEALDDVVDHVVQATVVDREGFEGYRRRKPARAVKLKVFAQSEAFPDTAIAYRAGALDEATLHRFRDALLKAGKDPKGEHVLLLWMITAFEPVPQDYEQMLTAIAKAYPAPPAAVKSTNTPAPTRR